MFIFPLLLHPCSPAANAGTEELHKLVGLHVQQLVEVRSAEGKLAERALLRRLGDEGIFLSLLSNDGVATGGIDGLDAKKKDESAQEIKDPKSKAKIKSSVRNDARRRADGLRSACGDGFTLSQGPTPPLSSPSRHAPW